MSNIRKAVSTALFIAAGVALPLAFHAVPNAGRVFLPMHIPVLLCGLVCGLPWGPACGIAATLLSSLLTGMPPAALLPAMLCELAAYGLAAALLARYVPVRNSYARLYLALAGAMLSGRLVLGAVNALIFSAGSYSMRVWLTGAFVTALPGIAIQLALVPPIVFGLQRAGLAQARR